jgi:hypothetical protein
MRATAMHGAGDVRIALHWRNNSGLPRSWANVVTKPSSGYGHWPAHLVSILCSVAIEEVKLVAST